MIEACPACGVLDALGRHEGTCPRAVELGLLRLADGEDPIVAIDEVIEEGPVVVPEEEEPRLAPTPEPRRSRRVPEAAPPELWLAYQDDFSEIVVFDSELAALRHAVQGSMRVRPLELGRGVREQIGETGPTASQQAAGDHASTRAVGEDQGV